MDRKIGRSSSTRAGERLGAPRVPVDRVVGVLEQVRARLAGEPVRVSGARSGSAMGRWYAGREEPAAGARPGRRPGSGAAEHHQWSRSAQDPGQCHLTRLSRLKHSSQPAPGVVGYAARLDDRRPRQGDGSLDRWLRAALAALLIALVGRDGAVAPVAAAARVPKVAVIVGPVGRRHRHATRPSPTRRPRRPRRRPAPRSSRSTPRTRPGPPSSGRSPAPPIVVYLGHGNGWPSRYRDALYPPTQNGFGLNPVAGGDDNDHQYFGEASVGKLQFAPERRRRAQPPLLRERQHGARPARGHASTRRSSASTTTRRASCAPVPAPSSPRSYLGPEYYVKSVLRGRGSIEDIWSSSPTVNGRHDLTAPSVRTPGYRLHLDPERASSGFVRSLVSRGPHGRRGQVGRQRPRRDRRGDDEPRRRRRSVALVRRHPVRRAAVQDAADRGHGDPPHAAARAAGRSTRIPAGAQVSVRWDPILLDAPPAPAPTVEPAPTPAPTPTPTPEPTPVPEPTIDPNIIARFENPNAPDRPARSPRPRRRRRPRPSRRPRRSPRPRPSTWSCPSRWARSWCR